VDALDKLVTLHCITAVVLVLALALQCRAVAVKARVGGLRTAGMTTRATAGQGGPGRHRHARTD
jgi:hypothetical protein